ncbi:MAG: FtsQ-type POTRA domain-containing protein [Archangium sp.]
MLLRTKRNRRRIDVAKKSGELAAAAKSFGSVALKLLALIATFVAIGFGANEGWNWARTTPRFGVHDVIVRGQVEATDVELVRLGGILLGQNLIAMDPAAMERSIATHPWIKSVVVRREFPNKLHITVTEHRAVAMMSLGELYLVNELATPFKRIKAGDNFDLPLVTGIDREKFAANDPQSTADLARALELIDAWNSKDGVSEITLSEVNLHPEGVSVVTAAGQRDRIRGRGLGGEVEPPRPRAEGTARSLDGRRGHSTRQPRASFLGGSAGPEHESEPVREEALRGAHRAAQKSCSSKEERKGTSWRAARRAERSSSASTSARRRFAPSSES